MIRNKMASQTTTNTGKNDTDQRAYAQLAMDVARAIAAYQSHRKKEIQLSISNYAMLQEANNAQITQ